jgi:hypothetical protein
MSDNRIDSSRISKAGQDTRPIGVAPSWIPPVLKRFYEFTRKNARAFSNELREDKREEREEELVKAVAKSFKGDV